jgi:hypothetical protein
MIINNIYFCKKISKNVLHFIGWYTTGLQTKERRMLITGAVIRIYSKSNAFAGAVHLQIESCHSALPHSSIIKYIGDI